MASNILKHKISAFLQEVSKRSPDYDEEITQKIYALKINKEKSPFSNKTLKKLDFSRFLDNYLLPHLSSAREIANKAYFFSTIALINHKFGEHILCWEYLRCSEAEVAGKFRLILDFLLNVEFSALNFAEKAQILIFLGGSFKFIEKNYLSEELMKLVSPYLFLRTHKVFLKRLFLDYPKLIGVYQTIAKKSGNPEVSLKHVDFLPNILQDFLAEISEKSPEKWGNRAFVHYVYQAFQLFIDLLSQISTRRFLKYLLEAEQAIPILKTLKLQQYNSSFVCLLEDLEHFLKYPINEETGEVQNFKVQILLRSDFVKQLQFLLFKLFQITPTVAEIESLDFVKLIEIPKDLPKLLRNLNIRVPVAASSTENPQELLINVLKCSFPNKPGRFSKDLPLIPSNELIWDYKKIPDENVNEILSLPKLNLQFLDLRDYLLRNFLLFRLESAYEIRYDLEDSIKRMNPRFSVEGVFQGFHDWARMATKVNRLIINEIANPLLGHKEPSRVFAEIAYNTKEMPNYVKKEWESLREHEVLFLVSFSKKTPMQSEEKTRTNPSQNSQENEGKDTVLTFKERYGVKFVRGCEIVAQFDEKHKKISYETGDKKRTNAEGFERTLHVLFDPFQYQMDLEAMQQTEIYSDFQLLVRRKPKENNFKSILCTISQLINEKIELPEFLCELILGYGDSENATSLCKAKENPVKFDFLDTFVDEAHFNESFLSNSAIANELKTAKHQEFPSNGRVRTKQNRIRFNENQIKSIFFAMQHGVTLIVGPPGTGKTDVAVQIASLLYNNFPHERTLIITHSNYALNDIFEKIVRLDIDEGHLLRLGLGEKDLDLGKNFSKHGRINFLLEKRLSLLAEAKLLANCLGNQQNNELTCETAMIFFENTVAAKWREFSSLATKNEGDMKFFIEKFPFHEYLKLSSMFFFGAEATADAKDGKTHINYDVKSVDDLLNVFSLIWSKIEQMFAEIKALQLLEILRSTKERGNFLISQQARIIAMTSTHAAMKRSHFIEIGLEYDNVIFEESAQIMEIESFIPLVLQKSSKSSQKPRLKRVIMLGDENQLPPIIKNTSYQKLSNLEQSLFTRLLRLNTPYVKLSQQGRCRESILELFRWKYQDLVSMSAVFRGEYERMNCGFVNEYQFIDVNDPDGNGEYCPNPHFYQNLAEAEYVVATYMYMVLKGYDPNKITILTTYNGQKYLIRDIIHHKCSWSQIFRKPKKITTVDKFQGQQNDYVLLSLVRTKNIGHIRDPRRLIVAMSRAKLGLYVFGKFDLYKGFHEIDEIFRLFERRSLKLQLFIGEKWEERRLVGNQEVENNQLERRSVENYHEMYKIVENLLKDKIK